MTFANNARGFPQTSNDTLGGLASDVNSAYIVIADDLNDHVGEIKPLEHSMKVAGVLPVLRTDTTSYLSRRLMISS